jgi:hypothetical protein
MAEAVNAPTKYLRIDLSGHDKPALFEWELTAGEVARVPAGTVGRYWAPKYARLLAIYGPSNGGPGRSLRYEKLSGGGEGCGDAGSKR